MAVAGAVVLLYALVEYAVVGTIIVPHPNPPAPTNPDLPPIHYLGSIGGVSVAACELDPTECPGVCNRCAVRTGKHRIGWVAGLIGVEENSITSSMISDTACPLRMPRHSKALSIPLADLKDTRAFKVLKVAFFYD